MVLLQHSQSLTQSVLRAMTLVAILLETARFIIPHWQKFLKRLTFFKMEEKNGRLTGAFYFAVGALAAVTFFPRDTALVSLAVLSFADPLAAIVGRLKPVKAIYRDKSLGGSLFFLIVAVFFLSLYSSFSVVMVLVLALAITLVELISPANVENTLLAIISAILVESAKHFL